MTKRLLFVDRINRRQTQIRRTATIGNDSSQSMDGTCNTVGNNRVIVGLTS